MEGRKEGRNSPFRLRKSVISDTPLCPLSLPSLRGKRKGRLFEEAPFAFLPTLRIRIPSRKKKEENIKRKEIGIFFPLFHQGERGRVFTRA